MAFIGADVNTNTNNYDFDQRTQTFNDYDTTVDNDTTTTINGLNSADTVAFAKVMQDGATQREIIFGDTFKTLVQQSGKNFNQLVGGASSLITNATRQTENAMTAQSLQAESAQLSKGDGTNKMVVIGLIVVAVATLMSSGVFK